MKMNWLKAFSVATAMAAVTFGGVACQKEEPSPVEEAGDAMGEGLDNLGDALQDAGDEVKDATKDEN
jgi:hypothetical protein